MEVVAGVADGDVALAGGAGDVALEELIDREDAHGEVVVAEGGAERLVERSESVPGLTVAARGR